MWRNMVWTRSSEESARSNRFSTVYTKYPKKTCGIRLKPALQTTLLYSSSRKTTVLGLWLLSFSSQAEGRTNDLMLHL
jgi:hypothetical protein